MQLLPILAAAFLLQVPAQDTPAKPPPGNPAIDKEKLAARVDEIATPVVDKEGVPGLSIAIAHDGEIILEKGFGYADAARAQPARADTRYAIGSLTRQFTAVGILQLVEAKKLSLDDDVGKLLPGFPQGQRKITLRHLLSDTSGVPGLKKIVARHPEVLVKKTTEASFFKVFSDVPFDFEPGANVSTDTADYVLLSMILAKTSGMSHADYVMKNIVRGAELQQTTFCPLKDKPISFATGCKSVAEDGELEIPLAAAPDYSTQSLCSTVTDLVKWEKSLDDRVLLDETSSGLMFGMVASTEGKESTDGKKSTDEKESTGTKPADHGFAMENGKLGDFQKRSHSGGVGGFRVCLVHYPVPKITIAILANCAEAPVDRIEADIAKFVLGLPAPATADIALAPEDAARCAGLYQIATTQIHVEAKDDKLWYVTATGPRVRLLNRGNLQFAFENDPESQLTFNVRDGKCDGFTLVRNGFQTTGKRME